MFTSRLTAWETSESAYRPAAPPGERLGALVQYAVLAPSSHNTQPWRFRVAGDALELYADRSRALPVVDPEGRALIISCGAAHGASARRGRTFAVAERCGAGEVEHAPAEPRHGLEVVRRMCRAEDWERHAVAHRRRGPFTAAEAGGCA